MRIRILNLAFIILFLFLFFSLINLAIIHGIAYKELADKNCIRLIPQNGSRGKILDTRGDILVGSSLSYDVLVMPQPYEQLKRTFNGLSVILAISTDELFRKFQKGYTEPSVPVAVAKNIPLEKAVALEERKLDLQGVVIQTNALRSYPYGSLACHVVGYLSEIDRWRLTKLADYGYKTKDIVGMGGLEEKYDYYLRQEDGGLSVEVDHQGRFSRILGFRPPQSGKDIQLTLDIRIQRIAEDALQGNTGCVIIMNPNNGEVLAMASQPNFDPSAFVKRNNGRYVASLFNDLTTPLLNRALHGQYPPGSVFKPVVAAAALELGKITAATTQHCTGSLMVGRREFKCWGVHGDQDLTEGIAHSCDIYFYKTGLAVGPQAIHDFAARFGLGKATGIELPYEEEGFIANPIWKKIYKFQKWYDGDTANFAIGQGELLVTPLQMVRVMAVFANRGNLVTPYIVKTIDNEDVTALHRRITPLRLKRQTLDAVRKGLRDVVADAQGTANILAGGPTSVAGKTGTAQTSEGASHGWFAGFWPYEQPQYVICVFLEHGVHGYASAVVVKRIIEVMAQQGIL